MKDKIRWIRSMRYNPNGVSSGHKSDVESNFLIKDMPSFESYVRMRKNNRISSCRLAHFVGARSPTKSVMESIERVRERGYTRNGLAKMYGMDGEVYCKRWLRDALGWDVQEEVTSTSQRTPEHCGKSDGRLRLGDRVHLVEIKCVTDSSKARSFVLEDLPQMQSNMECSGVRSTIYVRCHRTVCRAWLIEFDESYWNDYIRPQSFNTNPEDNGIRKRVFIMNSARCKRVLIFTATHKGFEWHKGPQTLEGKEPVDKEKKVRTRRHLMDAVIRNMKNKE